MSKLDDLHNKLLASRKTPIPSQAEYESRERRMAQNRLIEVDRAPLADRRAAAAEFLDAMKERPETVAERIEWMLDGNYGFGVMMIAKEILGNPRMNRLAGLTHLIAVHEWMCPMAMAIAAWKKLDWSKKIRLDKFVEAVVRRAERGEE
jgi:hypothetical protein